MWCMLVCAGVCTCTCTCAGWRQQQVSSITPDFIYLYVYKWVCVGMNVHICVWGSMVPCMYVGQNKLSPPLDLELQAFARCSALLYGCWDLNSGSCAWIASALVAELYCKHLYFLHETGSVTQLRAHWSASLADQQVSEILRALPPQHWD